MASKPERAGEGNPAKPVSTSSLLSGPFNPGAAGGVKMPGQATPTGYATPMSMLQKLLGSNPAAQGAPATMAPPLKPINPKRVEPISHPELAFSPSDIGVWEVNRV
ncbi:hypothetical protein WJX81_008284 [Elliptochloris bilobata]|uniref:Uncharacterized protein n=1 Tax=Elliptochloris bilobata TaxID=381761 RepID=A0AAW1QZU3_9CHLO